MSSLVSVTMSPEEMIFTFKQKCEESFKEAWSRIYDCHGKTKPKMTLSLLLSNFYFGLALRYRYALDATAGGDFLHYYGDQAFNIIKKLIAIYSLPTDFDSSLVSIFARLNTLETQTACLKDCYGTLREHHDYVPINSEPSSWFPTVKITISGETFHARCDIMSEFCLIPKDVYESLNLWKLSEGGERISLTNKATIFPIGIAEGVFTKILGRMISTDYLVIECVGKGQITLGRSLLKLLGATIDVGKGIIKFTSTPCNNHVFPRGKSKGKRGRRKASGDLNASFENT
jgi:predicted aspartyl protease